MTQPLRNLTFSNGCEVGLTFCVICVLKSKAAGIARSAQRLGRGLKDHKAVFWFQTRQLFF